jgi:hypothetical protein
MIVSEIELDRRTAVSARRCGTLNDQFQSSRTMA